MNVFWESSVVSIWVRQGVTNQHRKISRKEDGRKHRRVGSLGSQLCLATSSSGGSSLLWWQSICLQCGRPGSYPWAGKLPRRREWRPTPVFWPRYSLWGHKELDTSDQPTLSLSTWESCLTSMNSDDLTCNMRVRITKPLSFPLSPKLCIF